MAWAGPYATRLLADMGAEVIKIESVDNWDVLRALTGQPPETERGWDKSPYFNQTNRNKYGCSLDLSKPDGRELFLRLAAQSDIVIENFRAEVMDILNLGYDVLSAVNDRLIVLSMPGHGKTGPERDFVTYGTNVEQLSGLCHLTGYEGGPPHKTGISYGDPIAGIAAAGAIALALWVRRRTGHGQYIELAQRETLISLIGEYIVAFSMNQREPSRQGNRDSSMAPHGCYRCSGDDEWITIACDETICAWTKDRTKEDAAEALQSAGVPAMPVLGVPEVFADEHLRARGFFEPVSHPIAGVWDVDGPPWRMSESPAHIRLPAPTFAEHNRYVFRELLGLSDEEIAELQAEGVTGTSPNRTVHD